jgi:hypothetical protein
MTTPHRTRRFSDLEDDYLTCRTISHSWDEAPNAEFKTIFNWVMPLRCTRCTTLRIDYLNNLGEVMGRRYIYPEGYGYCKDTKINLRAEMLRRRILARRVEASEKKRKEPTVEEAKRAARSRTQPPAKRRTKTGRRLRAVS